MKLLADTSALLAMTMRDDRYHAAAVAFVQRNPSARFVLTDLILSELATRVRARADAKTAVAVASALLGSRRYQMVFVDNDLLRGGLEKMARFADKRLSLVDCISFETMERLALASAFSFDRDFRDCGYDMLP